MGFTTLFRVCRHALLDLCSHAAAGARGRAGRPAQTLVVSPASRRRGRLREDREARRILTNLVAKCPPDDRARVGGRPRHRGKGLVRRPTMRTPSRVGLPCSHTASCSIRSSGAALRSSPWRLGGHPVHVVERFLLRRAARRNRQRGHRHRLQHRIGSASNAGVGKRAPTERARAHQNRGVKMPR